MTEFKDKYINTYAAARTAVDQPPLGELKIDHQSPPPSGFSQSRNPMIVPKRNYPVYSPSSIAHLLPTLLRLLTLSFHLFRGLERLLFPIINHLSFNPSLEHSKSCLWTSHGTCDSRRKVDSMTFPIVDLVLIAFL